VTHSSVEAVIFMAEVKDKLKVAIKTFGCTCADAQVLPREGSWIAFYAEPQVLMGYHE
jgi:hypothetical protein